jgi:hypothetical protein
MVELTRLATPVPGPVACILLARASSRADWVTDVSARVSMGSGETRGPPSRSLKLLPMLRLPSLPLRAPGRPRALLALLGARPASSAVRRGDSMPSGRCGGRRGSASLAAAATTAAELPDESEGSRPSSAPGSVGGADSGKKAGPSASSAERGSVESRGGRRSRRGAKASTESQSDVELLRVGDGDWALGLTR